MSNADRHLIQSALKGLTPVPAHLRIVDDVDDATLTSELEQLGDLPH